MLGFLVKDSTFIAYCLILGGVVGNTSLIIR